MIYLYFNVSHLKLSKAGSFHKFIKPLEEEAPGPPSEKGDRRAAGGNICPPLGKGRKYFSSPRAERSAVQNPLLYLTLPYLSDKYPALFVYFLKVV